MRSRNYWGSFKLTLKKCMNSSTSNQHISLCFSYNICFLWNMWGYQGKHIPMKFWEAKVQGQGFKNCMHTCVYVSTMLYKSSNFDITLASKIFERYFTEMFDYFFTETSFVAHL